MGAVMGTVQQKDLQSAIGLHSKHAIFNFKPYKLVFVSCNSRCRCQNINRSDNHGNISPKPRSGHRIVCDDINMYSFGGYNPSLTTTDEEDLAHDAVWAESKPLFKELWKYNVSTASWKRLDVNEIPDILASNAVLLSGRVLMVYGGTGVPFGANCSKDLFICDLGSNRDPLKFDLISALGNCPQPQYGQAIILINHYLYTIGGTTGFEYTCDIHRLNLQDRIWEAVYTCKGTDNEPRGRYRHEIAFDQNKIYVLGGGTSVETFDFQVVFAFNLLTCLWERVTTRPDNNAREAYPTPRRCHSCVQHGQFVYVMGGFTGNRMLKDFWRLDLSTLEWRKLPQLALDHGVYFHSSCLTPSGKLITFGGIVPSGNNSKRTSDVHTAWLCIPKLKEICWEAIMFYCPYLDSFSKTDLVALGLPSEFIQRLDLASD
uniref:Kelch domain-containing protein 10 n=1 Tax=Graphocephala atropunctata TaxID=36148 RepID=A0A1B6MI30_9HEMI